MPHTPGKLAETRSVFENGASEKGNNENNKEKLFPPPKPPRLADTETNFDEKPAEQQQAAKRKAPSPPKATKENGNGKTMEHNATTVIKRKAPEPPTPNQEESKVHSDGSSKSFVKISEVGCEEKSTKAKGSQLRASSVDEEGEGTPVPAKRERKGCVDTLDGNDITEGDQPTPKPRRKVQNATEASMKVQNDNARKESKEKEEKVNGSVKKAKKPVMNETVTIVATPIDERRSTKDNNSKQKPQEQPHIIQACVVEEKASVVATKSESSENTISVKAVTCNSSEVKAKSCRGEPTKVTSVEKTEKHSRRAGVARQVSDDVFPAVATEMKPPSSSRRTRESTKKADFAFKVPRRPTVKECQFDPNETVNLNDVNIHEMTFSFDFDQFDQELEKERKSMFKMSYEEKCKQVGPNFHHLFHVHYWL